MEEQKQPTQVKITDIKLSELLTIYREQMALLVQTQNNLANIEAEIRRREELDK